MAARPYANDYQFEFARELIQQEKLGQGTVTDLLVISLSANDLAGHAYGPDSPQMHAMALALDRQIGEFLAFLQQQYGNRFWIALTADHGIAPTNAASLSLRIPAGVIANKELKSELNKRLSAMLHKPGEYVRSASFPIVFLNSDAFDEKVSEADAETYVAQAMREMGFVTAYTKDQLASGEVAPTAIGRMYANSFSPYGGWWVMGQPASFLALVERGRRPRRSLQLRPARAAGLLRRAVQAGNLSRPGRAHRHGPDAGGASRNQQAHQLDRPRADAGAQLTERRCQSSACACKTTYRARNSSMTPPSKPALDMSVNVAGIVLKNPIIAASGTFGYGVEFEDVVTLDRLGGFVVKGLSREPMPGNPPPGCLKPLPAC